MHKFFKHMLFLFFVFVLFSCNSYESRCKKYEGQISKVNHVTVKIIESDWFFEGDASEAFSHYTNLLSEEDLRTSKAITVELPGGNIQTDLFLSLLYSAKRTAVNRNEVRTEISDGLKWFWQEGMIIDVYYNDLRQDKDVYIMQNGEHVFYKKGEEGVYYKMPREILKKYRFD